jgi:hypothetical protein
MGWGFGVVFTFCKNKQNYEMNKTIFVPMNKTPSVFHVRVLFILLILYDNHGSADIPLATLL